MKNRHSGFSRRRLPAGLSLALPAWSLGCCRSEPTGQRWCNNGVALNFVPEGEPLLELREA